MIGAATNNMFRLAQAEFFHDLQLSPDPLVQTSYVEPKYDLVYIYGRYLERYGQSPRLHALIKQGLDIEQRSHGPDHALCLNELLGLMPDGTSGMVIGHMYISSQVIQLASVSSMLLDADKHGKTRLQSELPGDMAYNNGTAVHPAHRGNGLQAHTTRVRREHAEAFRKSATVVPVGPGNIPSLKSQLDFDPDIPGFVAVAINDHNRLIMVNDFSVTTKVIPSVADLETGFTQLPQVSRAIRYEEPCIALPISYGLAPNDDYNKAADKLFNARYLDVACMTLGAQFTGYTDETHATVFMHVDALPPDMQVLQERQAILQPLI
jgi:hypothetical protein